MARPGATDGGETAERPAADRGAAEPPTADSGSGAAPVDAAHGFLRAVRTDGAADAARDRLDALSPTALDALSPAERLAFWINVYNGATGDALLDDPTRLSDRRRFFGAPVVSVAGTDLSLDEIEHGILRRSRWKYGLGYLPNPFPSAFVRRHRVAEPDPRIHFAVNCGAAACPAVFAYDPATVDEQLDHATETYLRGETVVADGTARVPRLMLWYRGDFGGTSGIREWLRRYGVIDADATPRIRYREYDWTPSLDPFRGRD
ncbi:MULTISPECIES: DUF547 domain-containing protein [unclassified Halorubrum]|uniref:DUF547 domain-containing protein n=1 Tax=unclassified Halorubrum TaxID=2642239 RepID=UPI0010F94F0B|nr:MULTISPECIES: DUF547 domain-containing protein [unclassified Halorubrum]TKX45199.1 DUF547 domain-containing protein [Halorubrum sp. ARQ200]TKX51627.1 DUF547 domain-containing protein [Halorubrum sp. ASP121]